MKKVTVLLAVIAALTSTVGLAVADSVEFRTTVSRNDMSVDGEFHLDLEMRITSGTTPRTLSSLTVDIYYGSELTAWGSDPSTNWGPSPANGYTIDCCKLSSYYRVLITGGNVKPGEYFYTGWDVTTSWKRVVTVRWTINTATSVNIRIYDATDAGAYFNNYQNDPEGNATEWVVSNQDLGDVSLPVELFSFTALAGDGMVTLKWTTQSEVDNLGFNIYRSTNDTSGFKKINGTSIEGAGSSSMPHEYSYEDTRLENGITYFYKLEDVDYDGNKSLHGPVSATPSATPTTPTENIRPTGFQLSQNYPNPFNPTTIIRYQLPEESWVTLSVYNTQGQLVRTLVEGKEKPGYKSFRWDGRDESENYVASGVYLYVLKVDQQLVQTRKMALIR